MLEQILRHLKNWFEVAEYNGKWSVINGVLNKTDEEFHGLQRNQYYRIKGSVFNDGLHKYDGYSEELTDEAFEGTVYALAVPTAVINLATEIAEWQAKNGDAAQGVYQQESFGGYSYTRATDANGNAVIWQSAFRTRLNPWRKT